MALQKAVFAISEWGAELGNCITQKLGVWSIGVSFSVALVGGLVYLILVLVDGVVLLVEDLEMLVSDLELLANSFNLEESCFNVACGSSRTLYKSRIR